MMKRIKFKNYFTYNKIASKTNRHRHKTSFENKKNNNKHIKKINTKNKSQNNKQNTIPTSP